MGWSQGLHRSPGRMIATAFCCFAISAAAFALVPAAGHDHWPVISTLVVLGISAVILMFTVVSRLRDAVQNEQWPEDQIQRWRERVSSPWWMAAMLLPFGGMIAVMVASPPVGHSRLRGSYWIFYLLVMCVTQVMSAFRQPASADGGRQPPWLGAQEVSKLRSEHWGKQ